MLIIGLTGGIGSGKTTVANFFSELGIDVIDADIIARSLTSNDPEILNQIKETFGEPFILPNGELNRKLLRDHIFSSTDEKDKLEAILHPPIVKILLDEISKIKSPYGIVSIPLLVESNYTFPIDRILVVDISEEQQLKYASHRDNVTSEDIKKIIEQQASRDERLKQADDVIENAGSIDDLKEKVLELHKQYLAM